MESYVLRELNIVNIPKSGNDQGPGHHFPIQNILKLLKLLTFSQTNEETVDIPIVGGAINLRVIYQDDVLVIVK